MIVSPEMSVSTEFRNAIKHPQRNRNERKGEIEAWKEKRDRG